jgi:hypothetical protein
MIRVDRKNAQSLNTKLIEVLAVPAKGNTFYGHNTRRV